MKREAARYGGNMADLAFTDLLLKEGPEAFKRPPKMIFSCKLHDEVPYHISMTNHYLSQKGDIAKMQDLEADYVKTSTASLTPKSMFYTYTWGDIEFNTKHWRDEPMKSKWTFSKGLKFTNIMTFPVPIVDVQDPGGLDKNLEFTGIDYSQLASLPTVNLLYMLSWDVIGFEEMTSYLARSIEDFDEVGKFIKIDTLSNTYAHLEFGGCKQESFFRNGQFEAAYVGVSTWKGYVGVVFEYKCLGNLEFYNAKDNANAKSQACSSYYFGKLMIDLSSGTLLRADMTELVSGVIINKENKGIPQQKRRFVQLELV